MRLDAIDRLRDQLMPAQDCVDVDLGLGAKADDRGAADMVDVLDHIADQPHHLPSLHFEQCRPGGVVVDDFYCAHVGAMW